MSEPIVPLFIFSLPRSGSTLLQRILGSHEKITTVSEPWLLLPYLYSLKSEGIYSEYGHGLLVKSINDLCSELPNGKDDYLAEIHALTLRIYTKLASESSTYFLDKTPRYHLVAEEIINLFPQAKIIFLWRNPLAIAASILESWGGSKWNLHLYQIDLFEGLANLTTAYSKHSKQVYSLQYESLISEPDKELKKLCDYLNISFNKEMISAFSKMQLTGINGDNTGIHQYSSISKEPLSKWQQTLTNPIRKIWFKNYLNWIGSERLAIMEYDFNQLIKQIHSIPVNNLTINSDLFYISLGIIRRVIILRLLKHRFTFNLKCI